MDYIIHFDIAAIFIFSIVIAFHFHKKNLPLFQNKIYITFLGVALTSTVFEVICTYIRMGTVGNTSIHVPLAISWFLFVIDYTASNVLPITYFFYALALSDFLNEKIGKSRKRYMFIHIIPCVLTLFYIWISPILYYAAGPDLGSKISCFFIDSNGVYSRGGGFVPIYLNSIFYISIVLVNVIRLSKELKPREIKIIILYIVLMVGSIAIQFVFPRLIIQCFGISLAAMMFAYIIQLPDEYIDKTTELFNEAAFTKMTTYDFSLEEEGLCISIILDDTAFMSNAFGLNQMNNFLLKVSQYLTETFPHALVYYIPQGKFCVIFKNYNIRDIERYVFELRARFQEPWISDTLELKLYSRICVIEYPKDVKTTEELLDVISMVSEDERYKRATIYARDIDTAYKKRTAYIAHLLRNAIAENRFDVYYQPIYSVGQNRLIGAEALIRLKDDQGEFVSPEEFIPISEKTGDILRIGQFVFESVCKTLSSISPSEYGISKIDINLSVAQCMQDILADQITTCSAIYNIPSSIINLEITETAAAHTPDILLKNMERLAEEGIELSLDDYGSGYSNMNYLLNLPFKMVKIDKNIVWAAFNDAKSNIALGSTITMIKRLGMVVLAEGVETKEQAEWLKSLGCDYLQGFYYSKALPKDEYLEMMKSEQDRIYEEKKIENIYLQELTQSKIDETVDEIAGIEAEEVTLLEEVEPAKSDS